MTVAVALIVPSLAYVSLVMLKLSKKDKEFLEWVNK